MPDTSPRSPSIAAFEPIYTPGQQLVEPLFAPLAVSNERADWREFSILVDLFRQGVFRRHDLTGLFSPRFGFKTRLTGKDVFDFVAGHPGADVYLFNAGADFPYYCYNIWMQGETSHPGIIERARALLDACAVNLPISPTQGRNGPDTLCFSNFWLGGQRVWDDYVGGVLHPIATFVEAHPGHPAVQRVMEGTFHTSPTPFLPFIVERLFSTWLVHARPAVRAIRLDPLVQAHSDYERDIVIAMRDRIDRADREDRFPPELIATLGLLIRLRRRFAMAYYAIHPHFNRGAPHPPELIEAALRELETQPVLKLE